MNNRLINLFTSTITTKLIVSKLANIIEWNWWLVLSPIYIPVILILISLFCTYEQGDKMNFSIEEIKMLAEFERKMDSGEITFVILRGNRIAVPEEIMIQLSLEPSQTITVEIHMTILQEIIKMAQEEMNLSKTLN